MNSEKKVLVIGGSGFLGSHTADELTKNGFKVSILDKKPSKWKKENQEFFQGDFLNEDHLKEALKGISYVYHFGAVADIEESKLNPSKTLEHNILGTVKLLEILKDKKIERLMFASTIYVYSDYGSFYRVSKQATETIIEEYSREFDINFTLMRYGSLYGERSQDWNGIKKFITQVLDKEFILYKGNGKEMREYINVVDAAKISVKLLDKKYKNKALMITGNQLIKAQDLFELIFEILGKKLNVKYLKESNSSDHYGNTPYRYSPKSAKKIVPTEFVDLGQGLLNLIEEIKER
jgi:UDP-glucose 4-epimerase